IISSGITARSGRMNITVDYHQTNQKTNTGKTLKPWPILVDHYIHFLIMMLFLIMKQHQLKQKKIE
ncbi:hypothetical protein MJ634_001605, partial [Providencia rettgeri]|uniref:hypothetical protein n=1 Tax=Providencia rettgeri TaxID=587 RepID=UPI0024ABA19D|nr:hypothetical protein [Providencia rettgeri]MCJ2287616.1 hypothetical protein [Providencia rettgeri]MDY0821606.1 hypothetical protein [Providencia rettgeri]